MAIEDQIRDEKIQYDINREAAKVSALSSGKIDKYEYLTGEEILSSNQQKIIEQAKFTYSPLVKTFEKQTKIIKDQGKKQIEAIQDNKRLDKIEELNKKIYYSNLKYIVLSTGEGCEFDKSEDPLVFLNNIKKGKISLREKKNLQKDYNEYLNKIRKGNKNEEQKNFSKY